MKSAHLFYAFLAVFFNTPVLSQTGEMPVKSIPQVIVVESNKEFFSDDKTTFAVDPQLLLHSRTQSLGYLLERETPALIKSYGGSGSLVSLSLHGTGSNHTQVSWNGFPLNSPTTGQVDLSLLPIGFIQSVELVNGASGALFGSGTFGGSVNLCNKPDWNNRFSVVNSLEAGSYGALADIFSIRAGSDRLQVHMSAISGKAENNFTYKDTYRYEAPEIVADHNSWHSLGLIQNLYLNLGKGNYLEAGAWFHYKTKDVPALMGSYKESHAIQKDSTFRSYISFRKTTERSALIIRSAWFSDFLHYTDKFNSSDTALAVDSRIATGRFMNEADYRYYLSKKLILGGGVTYNLLTGNSNNYGGEIRENEYSLYGNVKYSLAGWILNAGIRKEFYKGINPRVQYSAGLRYRAGERLVLRSGLSSKFRKPTFNEKYWNPGGNPGLRPEKGWGGEVAAEYRFNRKSQEHFRLEGTILAYFQRVDNWIQWVIRDSLTPVEYKKVHARGIEARLDFDSDPGLIGLRGFINYGYNRSILKETYDRNPLFENNQLMYVPLHTIRASITASCKGFELGAAGMITSPRETVETADETLRLPAYGMMDLSGGYQGKLNGLNLGIFFRIINLFDHRYEVIRSFPMPGRMIQLTITVGWEKLDANN